MTDVEFKGRCRQVLPTLADKLNGTQWEALINAYNTSSLNPRPQKLTASYLIDLLSEALDVTRKEVILFLQHKNSGRAVKMNLPELEEEFYSRAPSYSRKRKRREEDPSREIVTDDNSLTRANEFILNKYKVRIVSLAEEPPTNGFNNVKSTPGGRKVRPILESDGITYYTPLSPFAKRKGKDGMDNPTAIDRSKVTNLTATRINSVAFEVSLESIREAANNKRFRRTGQNSLTRASCREVFEAHSVETIIKRRGSEYHWSHIIGLCLGGKHALGWLVPATATSNYNTFELVESFILEKLSKDRFPAPPIEKITMIVTPEYNNLDSLIPNGLKFDLSWEEKDTDLTIQNKSHTIYINTRSHRACTETIYQAINGLRNGGIFSPATKKEGGLSARSDEDFTTIRQFCPFLKGLK